MRRKGIAAIGLTAALAATAWLLSPGTADSSGRRPDATRLAMGPGMTGGGMMGGYGPGMGGGYGPGPQRAYPASNSPAARLYAEACAQCHALPDPRAHTAQQWPAVVSRMESHMRDAGMAVPDPQQTEQIDAFLEQNASAAR